MEHRPIHEHGRLGEGPSAAHLHAARAQAGQLLLHAISDAGVHGSATGENDVSVEVATDVQVALEDGVVTVWEKVRYANEK